MFRLFALIAVVLVVGFIWWAVKELRKTDKPKPTVDNDYKNNLGR